MYCRIVKSLAAQCGRHVAVVLLLLSSLLVGCVVGETDHNLRPTASAGENITLGAGDMNAGSYSVNLNGHGSDSDGQIVAVHWQQLSGPTVSFSNPDSDAVTVSFTPALADTAVVLRFTVTDDKGAEASDDITISWGVSAKPSACSPDMSAPLVVTAGADIEAVVGDRVDLTAEVIHSEGDVVYISWQRIAGNDIGSALYGTNTLNAWFSAKLLGSDTVEDRVFQVTVQDAAGHVASDCVQVRVSATTGSPPPANTPPSVNAGADQRVAQGSTV